MNLKDTALNILKGDTCIGVEVLLQGDGNNYNVVTLKKKDESIELVNDDAITDIDTIDKNLPIVLVINGKGVVSKLIESSNQNISDEYIAKQLLPNINVNDFFVQYITANSKQLWGALVRKEVVTDLIKEIALQGLIVVDVYLGPIVTATSLKLLKDEEVNVNGLKIEHNQGDIKGLIKTTAQGENISIGSDRLNSGRLTAFAAALHYALNFADIQGNNAIGIKGESEYKHKRIFQLGGWTMMIVVLCISIANYFAFDHYHNTYADLDNKLAESSAKLQVIDDLKSKVEGKKQLLQQTGLLDPSKTSFYADRIAKTVPPSMLLAEMEIYPFKKRKVKGETVYEYESGKVKIIGFVQNSSTLNDWIKELKTYDWINEVVINNYDKLKKSNESQFELEITLVDVG